MYIISRKTFILLKCQLYIYGIIYIIQCVWYYTFIIHIWDIHYYYTMCVICSSSHLRQADITAGGLSQLPLPRQKITLFLNFLSQKYLAVLVTHSQKNPLFLDFPFCGKITVNWPRFCFNGPLSLKYGRHQNFLSSVKMQNVPPYFKESSSRRRYILMKYQESRNFSKHK